MRVRVQMLTAAHLAEALPMRLYALGLQPTTFQTGYMWLPLRRLTKPF